MKTEFTKEYMLVHRGCYDREKMLSTPFINNEVITLKGLFEGLLLEDYCWFLVNKCELTIRELKELALHCARQVEPIFNKECPDDKRLSECNKATRNYLDGKISRSKLLQFEYRADNVALFYEDVDLTVCASSSVVSAANCAYSYSDCGVSSHAYEAAYYAISADTEALKEPIWTFTQKLIKNEIPK